MLKFSNHFNKHLRKYKENMEELDEACELQSQFVNFIMEVLIIHQNKAKGLNFKSIWNYKFINSRKLIKKKNNKEINKEFIEKHRHDSM